MILCVLDNLLIAIQMRERKPEISVKNKLCMYTSVGLYLQLYNIMQMGF